LAHSIIAQANDGWHIYFNTGAATTTIIVGLRNFVTTDNPFKVLLDIKAKADYKGSLGPSFEAFAAATANPYRAAGTTKVFQNSMEVDSGSSLMVARRIDRTTRCLARSSFKTYSNSFSHHRILNLLASLDYQEHLSNLQLLACMSIYSHFVLAVGSVEVPKELEEGIKN
jgi:hypothetical protein